MHRKDDMDAMPRVVICRSARRDIFRHTLSAGMRETGGILMGIQRGELLLVLAAGGPGLRDEAAEAEFMLLDLEHHQTVLDEFQEFEPSAHWVGTWHKHPRDYRHPSRTDLDQAERDLAHYRPMHGLLMPITFADPGGPSMSVFWFSGATHRFHEIEAQELDLETGLPWERTATARRSVGRLRARLSHRGFRTRRLRGDAQWPVYVEATHPERGDHRLFLLCGGPNGATVVEQVFLAHPEGRRGEFISNDPATDLSPIPFMEPGEHSEAVTTQGAREGSRES